MFVGFTYYVGERRAEGLDTGTINHHKMWQIIQLSKVV